LIVSRAITRDPIAACTGTSNICRGISSRSFSTSARPRPYASDRCTMIESASTASPASMMSTRTRSASAKPVTS
jgi:hypothetical protein